MSGKIVKVSGPLVVATGLTDANMADVVRVGEQRLIGEILTMNGDAASIQVYEETSGLGPGAVVETTGAPLSVELGPGIIENIYDGIQRPLEEIMKKTGGNNLPRGVEVPALDRQKEELFSRRSQGVAQKAVPKHLDVESVGLQHHVGEDDGPGLPDGKSPGQAHGNEEQHRIHKSLQVLCAGGVPELLSFCNTVEKHLMGIVYHAKFPISSGKVEWVNNMIKTIRRKAYGYTDTEYFFLRIMFESRKPLLVYRSQKSHNFLN